MEEPSFRRAQGRKRGPRVLAAGFIVGALAAWFAWGWWGVRFFADHWTTPAPGSPPADRLAQLGQAGDLFGGINALFAALAFVGVAIAAYLQREQLVDARAAAAAANEDAKAARIQLDTQYARQAFEPLFFKLLELLHQRAETMQLRALFNRAPNGAYATHDFRQGLSIFRDEITRTMGITQSPDSPSGWVDRLVDKYTQYYLLNEGQLGPYFRTLYRALKLIHNAGISEAEKVEYANIVRGLLGRDELLLLMLNWCTPMGQRMKAYAELYGLLKHTSLQEDKTTVADRRLATECFAPTAGMSHLERLAYWGAGNPKSEPTID